MPGHAGWFTGFALLLVVVSLPGLVEQARDVDVLLYQAAAARANAEGALPYEEAWIEKGPLAMGLFQVLGALFGDYNFAALGTAWIVLAVLAAWQSAALARRLGERTGAWAALLFAVSIGTVGGTLNTELPASVMAAGGVLAWLRAVRPGPRGGGWMLVAGLLVGAAFLCRQNAGILWPLLALCSILGPGEAAGPGPVRSVLILCAGFVSIVGGTIAVYAASGSLAPFLFCFYSYNADIYIAATHVDLPRLLRSPLTAARNFLYPVMTVSVAGSLGILLALTGIGTRDGPFAHRRRQAVVIALAALVLTASLFVGLRFFGHYFALPLPFWAAAGGWAVERAIAWATRRAGESMTGRRVAAGAVACAVILSAGWEVAARPLRESAWRLVKWARTSGIERVADPILWPGRDGLATATARFIRENGTPGERIFVWGMRPHVYAYSRAVPATRFVTCTFLTGLVPWERSAPEEDTTRWIVPGSWDLLMLDLEADRPLFIVDASHDHLFGGGAYAPERFPLLDVYIRSGYEKVFEVGEEDRMIVWRRRSAEDRPGTASRRGSDADQRM